MRIFLTISLHLMTYIFNSQGLQSWINEPVNSEVNPGDSIVLQCLVKDKKGECRWEKDGSPIGIYPSKYEWFTSPESGDCSLKILDATLEYDDGVWQCQVTPSSFSAKDALISEGAELIIRESPSFIAFQKNGIQRESSFVTSSGKDLNVDCFVRGGNPPSKITWYLNHKELKSHQENRRSNTDSRTWISTSSVHVSVTKSDNNGLLECRADHPTLEKPLTIINNLTIHYAPIVSVTALPVESLEEGKTAVTLKCIVDSNPSASVEWRRDDLSSSSLSSEIFSHETEIHFSPVTRNTAGKYSCIASNSLGRSEPANTLIDVLYPPKILYVGPSKNINARVSESTTLTCKAEGNPKPVINWLQMLPSQEVLIRGSDSSLRLANVSYEHQGEFVCRASNSIRGVNYQVQSEPLVLQVSGSPIIRPRYSSRPRLEIQRGDEAVLKVSFCGSPVPHGSWHLGDHGSLEESTNVILAPGTSHGRFFAEEMKESSRGEDCFVSTLRIVDVSSEDSKSYNLRVFNEHGEDNYFITLSVVDSMGQETLIAISVGVLLTLLLLLLFAVHASRASKKDSRAHDAQSDKTDLESTISSHGGLAGVSNTQCEIPYLCRDKTYVNYDDDPFIFNDSKESLKPDGRCSNESKVNYNDLCYPKTSNYGSMKKKKTLRYAHNSIYGNNV